MFVSKNKNLLFFHIPKTAGTSLRTYLYENCKDSKYFTQLTFSMFVQQYPNSGFRWRTTKQAFELPAYLHLSQPESNFIIKNLNFNLENFTELVIVRNPYDRLISYYNFVLYKNYNDMNKFLDDLELNKIDPNLHFRYQLDYIKNPVTKNLKIFKYENLIDCEKFLQEIIGTDKVIPKMNITNNSYIETLEPYTKERIYKLFEEEFDILEYNK